MKTKFRILQDVWYMHNNTPKKSSVESIEISTNEIVTYKVGNQRVIEGRLAATKEELKTIVFGS